MQPQSQQSQSAQGAAQPASQAAMPSVPMPQPVGGMPPSQDASAATQQPSQQPATQNSASPAGQAATADDGDVIEKEWVLRVRQIIAETAQDPYQQNKQLTELKAEYMQKRYGKTIKLSD